MKIDLGEPVDALWRCQSVRPRSQFSCMQKLAGANMRWWLFFPAADWPFFGRELQVFTGI